MLARKPCNTALRKLDIHMGDHNMILIWRLPLEASIIKDAHDCTNGHETCVAVLYALSPTIYLDLSNVATHLCCPMANTTCHSRYIMSSWFVASRTLTDQEPFLAPRFHLVHSLCHCLCQAPSSDGQIDCLYINPQHTKLLNMLPCDSPSHH